MTTPSTYKLGYPPIKYSSVPFAGYFDRDPTTSDLYSPRVGGFFKLGTVWVNRVSNGAFMLTSITSGTTANWEGITGPATGDVAGPASSTNTAIARFNGITGKLLENSVGLMSSTGHITGITATLNAGTTVAGTAPLYFIAGTNLTSAVSGAVEYDGTFFTYTDSVPTRNTLAVAPGASTANGLASWSSTTGYKLLSNTPTISSGVITFPANGGNVMTTGTRKGTSSFGAGGISAAITTAAVKADSVIVITRTNLAGAAAALGQYVTITPNTSFIVTSGDAADTSSFTWAIVG